MASQPDDNTQPSNSNINNKKRAREEQYPGESPAQSSKEGAVDPAPANERSPKKPRTDKANSKFHARIDVLINALLNSYEEVQTARGEHPVDKGARTTVEVDKAQRFILMRASEFMDGPLLFNSFPWLQGKYRQLLRDLDLPLDQIRILAAETEKVGFNDHGLYHGTKKEVKSRCAEILRVLRRDIITNEPITRSYDDAEARNQHDRKLEEQVASMITTQSRESENKLAVAFEAIASSNTAIASSNAAIASALKENAQTRSSQEVPSKGVSCSAAPVISMESASEDSSEAVREEYERKIQYQLERVHQEKASWYLKVEHRLREYNDGIEDLKKTQHGGPVPLSIMKLNVADTSACYHRLVQLWKDLKIAEGYDVTKLTMNKDLCYSFAIAMREAHFLLHLLVFYGDGHTELRNTGWSLDLMRSLQSDMTPYASDEPLIYCKEDVDVICIALQNAFPGQPLFKAPLISACTQVPKSIQARPV
ncbi:hypothetical protein E8E13_000359 [Curvularia kusanoi]|uniref:Uncharacterized protein n=1 Tax=Curvularia kusanoi TaxID=90978 RepID=A0A9P4W2S5_CURKU|nr:hypothetical protein E8E13_000359 [Curvularia kusanoi]